MTCSPTHRQGMVLDFVCDFAVERLRAPAIWEIAEEFDVDERTARRHVAGLIERGWLLEIRREESQDRPHTFEVADVAWGRLGAKLGKRRREAPAVARALAVFGTLLQKLSPEEKLQFLEAVDRPMGSTCSSTSRSSEHQVQPARLGA